MEITDIRAASDPEVLAYATSLEIKDPACSVEELNSFLASCNPQCVSLVIWNEKIEELPEVMGGFTRLEQVILELPNLKKLPAFFQGAAYRRLSIACVEMPGIPEEWNYLGETEVFPQLVTVSLNVDKMWQLPACFCLPTLKTLRIRSKKLPQLPEEFVAMSGLEGLIIKAPLRQLPELNNCPKLETLKLEDVEIETFSTTDAWPERLESLQITSKQRVKKGPVFSFLKELRYLKWKSDQPSQIDLAGISACKFLNELKVQNISLHPDLKECQQLESLTFEGGELVELPAYVTGMKCLKHLQVTGTGLSRVPEDWSALKNLEFLELANNQLEDFSFLYTLSSLYIQRISIEGNPIRDPLFMLDSNHHLPIATDVFKGFSLLNASETLRFVQALVKSKLSRKDKEWFFYRFKELTELKIPNDWPVSRLLQAFHIDYSLLHSLVVNWLLALSEAQEAETKLCAGAKVLLLGKFHWPEQVIAKNLEVLGLTLCKQWEDGISHIVIGKCPPVALPEVAFIGACVLLENQLCRLLMAYQSGFLQDVKGEKAFGERLVRMLRSDDPATQILALEILEKGGVPEPLFMELLLLQKCSEKENVRAEAKKLLEIYGPAEWLSLVWNADFENLKEESKDIYEKQCFVETFVGRELLARFSFELFQRHGKGLPYLLVHLPLFHPWRLKTLETLTTDSIMDLSHGGGQHSKIRLKFPSDYPYKKKVTQLNLEHCNLKLVPCELAEFENLVELDLSLNLLEEFPEAVLSLKKLRSLDLFGNGVQSVPANIVELEQLEELGLNFNTLKEFPLNVLQLNQLKRLDLGSSQFQSFPNNLTGLEQLEELDFERNKLRVFPKGILQLRRLKSLNLNTNLLQSLPANMGGLERLEELDLSYNKLSTFPMEVLALKSLKRLDLRANLHLLSIPKEASQALPDCEILL
ncbi:hypothetical protein AAG747_11675 [Rapidithrix thailandica]|uniref:Uncharacterized protein n=1 Tax=Rapidithrix thailandica TaxID=413964 RepID=A0AAW9S6J9_9BACT